MVHVVTAAIVFAGIGTASANPLSSVQILAPPDAVNYSSTPVVAWQCVPGFTTSRVVLHDSNGLLIQDTGWVPTSFGIHFCSNAPSNRGIGHDIPLPGPDPGKPGERFIKGLIPGHYDLELDLKDNKGQMLTAAKGFDNVPNLELTFGTVSTGKWTAPRGDWESITPSTFGALGLTSQLRDIVFYNGPVYVNHTSTLGNFDESHAYSYTAVMKINCANSSCSAGPSLNILFQGNNPDAYYHVDFPVSGDGQLSVQVYSERDKEAKGGLKTRL